MSLTPYNGFSPEYRASQGRLQERLFREGTLTRPTVCESCGQTSIDGQIIAHLEDYDDVGAFIGTCCRCHMALHCRWRFREGWWEYKRLIRKGYLFRPHPQHDFHATRREMGAREWDIIGKLARPRGRTFLDSLKL